MHGWCGNPRARCHYQEEVYQCSKSASSDQHPHLDFGIRKHPSSIYILGASWALLGTHDFYQWLEFLAYCFTIWSCEKGYTSKWRILKGQHSYLKMQGHKCSHALKSVTRFGLIILTFFKGFMRKGFCFWVKTPLRVLPCLQNDMKQIQMENLIDHFLISLGHDWLMKKSDEWSMPHV